MSLSISNISPQTTLSNLMEAHQRGRYRVLPLFATPLEQEGGHGHHQGHSNSEPSFEQEQNFKSDGHIREIEVIRDDTPAFREKEEASTIELFYDLFFVANLTSFTNVHAIDDRSSKQPLSLDPFSPFFFFLHKKKKKILRKLFNSHLIIHWLFCHLVVHLAAGRPLRRPIRGRLRLRANMQIHTLWRHGQLCRRGHKL